MYFYFFWLLLKSVTIHLQLHFHGPFMQNTFVSYKSLLVLGLSCYKARVTEKGGGVSLGFTRNPYLSFSSKPAVGIYKRKQEGKKKRKQELDQESYQEKKKLAFFWILMTSHSAGVSE